MRRRTLPLLSLLAVAATGVVAPEAHAGRVVDGIVRAVKEQQKINAAAKDFNRFVAQSPGAKKAWERGAKLANKKHLPALTYGWVGMGGGGAGLITFGLVKAFQGQPVIFTAFETILGAREVLLAAKHLPAGHAEYRHDRQRGREVALWQAKKQGIEPTAAQLKSWRDAGLVLPTK